MLFQLATVQSRRLRTDSSAWSEPQSLSTILSLSALISIVKSDKDVCGALSHLHSVIHVRTTPGEAVRVLHPSFVDFITNKEWCTDSHFLVDVRFREIFLARNCLEPITNSLRQNLAGIEDKTDGFEGRVKEVIPSQLQYARLHWASHMIATEHEDEMCLSSLHEFTHGSLLYWVEAMGFLGDVRELLCDGYR